MLLKYMMIIENDVEGDIKMKSCEDAIKLVESKLKNAYDKQSEALTPTAKMLNDVRVFTLEEVYKELEELNRLEN